MEMEGCLVRGPCWGRGTKEVRFFRTKEKDLETNGGSSEEGRLDKNEELLGERKWGREREKRKQGR